MSIYTTIAGYLKEGKTGMLATVVRKLGAAPREEGAKMFIGEDGKTSGTIGGGRLEEDVYRETLNDMGSRETKLLQYRMDGKAVEEEGMLCGGDVDIFVEPVMASHREVYQEVQNHIAQKKRALVVTKFRENQFSKTLISATGEVFGDPLSQSEISEFQPHMQERQLSIDDDILLEPLNIMSIVYIFGAGHVSQFLSKVSHMVDFSVVVVDDNNMFANNERFPEADRIIVADFEKVAKDLRFKGDEYIVIVTRGHRFDAVVLEEVLKGPKRYVGMIGSKRKVSMVLDYLREKGFSDEILKTVHAPIGIDINSETPQEIAISIVSQLIKVRGAS